MSKVTPEILALIVELLPTIGSLRDLCAVTGLRLDTIRRETAPFLAIMKLQGTHPQCGCGKDRFHPYGCADSYKKSWPEDCIPGRTRAESAVLYERRRVIIEMLAAGDRFCDIDARFGLSKGSAKSNLRFMSPEQREGRGLAVERRKAAEKKARAKKAKASKVKGPDPEPVRPFRDRLYSEIASAVPRWLSPALREDVISEMYVAICDGTLDRSDIAARAKRFATTAQRQFESKYGPVSIDLPRWETGSATIGDCIPDPSALLAFDYIFEKAA